MSISWLFNTLIQTYGTISEEQILEQKSNIRTKVYNIVDTLIILFNEVKDLIVMATAASNPYSDIQIKNLGLKPIKN